MTGFPDSTVEGQRWPPASASSAELFDVCRKLYHADISMNQLVEIKNGRRLLQVNRANDEGIGF